MNDRARLGKCSDVAGSSEVSSLGKWLGLPSCVLACVCGRGSLRFQEDGFNTFLQSDTLMMDQVAAFCAAIPSLTQRVRMKSTDRSAPANRGGMEERRFILSDAVN